MSPVTVLKKAIVTPKTKSHRFPEVGAATLQHPVLAVIVFLPRTRLKHFPPPAPSPCIEPWIGRWRVRHEWRRNNGRQPGHYQARAESRCEVECPRTCHLAGIPISCRRPRDVPQWAPHIIRSDPRTALR